MVDATHRKGAWQPEGVGIELAFGKLVDVIAVEIGGRKRHDEIAGYVNAVV